MRQSIELRSAFRLDLVASLASWQHSFQILHSTVDSILASCPAGQGSNHGSGVFQKILIKKVPDVAVLIDCVHCLDSGQCKKLNNS